MSFTGNFHITKNTAVYYQTSCDNTSFKYVRCKTCKKGMRRNNIVHDIKCNSKCLNT